MFTVAYDEVNVTLVYGMTENKLHLYMIASK